MVLAAVVDVLGDAVDVAAHEDLGVAMQAVGAEEAGFLLDLTQAEQSIAKVAEQHLQAERLSDPSALGTWLHQWWENELLRV